MIFVAVGTQLPFDRLARTVDEWAGKSGHEVIAQIGASSYRPKHMVCSEFVDSGRFRELVESADVVVAHAGMGTIITALELGKPLIVMPRRGALHEARNDHQIATAEKLGERRLATVAWDERELRELLERIETVNPGGRIRREASPELLETVQEFLTNGRVRLNGNGAGNGTGEPAARKTSGRSFDGVICFGGVDWWYHNRGHYDLQMMRELSRRFPVLYVNSLAMRTPSFSEGRMFFRRVARKLRSVRRGLQVVRPNFCVYTAFNIPRFKNLTLRRIVPAQVRRAAKRMGIEKPLLWVACPPAAEIIDRIPHEALVYQRTDRFEAYPSVNPEEVAAWDRSLKEAADLTLYCSSALLEEEKDQCRATLFADHGVDYELFADDDGMEEPIDLRSVSRPRVGFVGGIDAHTFDPELFKETASRLPGVSFVLVGSCSLPEGWCELPNVHLLGQRPYEEVGAYMRACDVLIMPWNRNDWIEACNPVKLKEYLATGRPIVSTPFGELERYRGLVRVAGSPGEFVEEVRSALDAAIDPARSRAAVKNETWTAKADLVLSTLDEPRREGARPEPREAVETEAIGT